MTNARLLTLQNKIDTLGIDAFLITNPENIFYLTGFTGTAGISLVTKKEAFFLTDPRYLIQAQQEIADFEIRKYHRDQIKAVAKFVKSIQLKNIGFESRNISFDQYQNFCQKLNSVNLLPFTRIIEKQRLIKDKLEIESIKKAVHIALKAFKAIPKILKEGMKEVELAAELEFLMKKSGSQGVPFNVIVASGKRSALPHGTATNKSIEAGDFITVDLGARYAGYNSDITRTYLMGTPTQKQERVYKAVKEAQTKAIQEVKAGKKCSEIDTIAREIIKQAGYEKYFQHGTGHGLGLSVHEEPQLTQGNKLTIQEGMTFTIEPGIYIKNWGGVRIEDMILVTSDGADVLTADLSKELIVI